MSKESQKSDKQRFKLCVPSCPRLIMGGDTHSLCIACLEQSMLSQLSRELTVLIASGSHCACSAPRGRSLRRVPSVVFLAAQVPLLPNQSSSCFCGDCKWIWQRDRRWASPFFHPHLPGPMFPLGVRKHDQWFLPSWERARRATYLPPRRLMLRMSRRVRLWIPSSMRSCWRW